MNSVIFCIGYWVASFVFAVSTYMTFSVVKKKFIQWFMGGLFVALASYCFFEGCRLLKVEDKQEQSIEQSIPEHTFDSIINNTL